MAFIDSHVFTRAGATNYEASDGVNTFVQRFEPAPLTPTQAYSEWLRAGWDWRAFKGRRWLDHTHVLRVHLSASAGVSLATAVRNTDRAISEAETWVITPAQGTVSTAYVLGVVSDPVVYDPDPAGRWTHTKTYRITCEPGWEEASVAMSLTTISPGVFEFLCNSGLPCRTLLTLTHPQATSFLAVALRSFAVQRPTYNPRVEVSGTADATAYGGQAGSLTMNGDFNTIAAYPTFAIGDASGRFFRGRYTPIARLTQPDATPADTSYQTRASLAGFNISDGADSDSAEVAATVQNSYEHVVFDPTTLPTSATATDTGYEAGIGIQAKNAGGGAVKLDFFTLMPSDEALWLIRHAFSAGQGVRIDSRLNDAFLADADGYGRSLLYRSATDQTERIGRFEARPGYNYLVRHWGTPGNAAPQVDGVSGAYWPRNEFPAGA